MTYVKLDRGTKRLDSPKHLQQLTRRRMVLNHYLNGDISEDRIIHFSPMLRSRDEVLKEFQDLVVPALIPYSCPVLNRGKWLGCEQCFSWVGLLAAHHNILQRLMVAWKGSSHLNPGETSIQEGPVLGLQWSSWTEVAQKFAHGKVSEFGHGQDGGRQPLENKSDVAIAVSVLPHDEDSEGDDFDKSYPMDPNTGDIDWKEYNKATVKKAVSWAETNPMHKIIVITSMWQPVLRLMRRTIVLGSEAWEKEQIFKQSLGQTRSYRALEMYLGTDLKMFINDVNTLLHQVCDALPPSAYTNSLRNLMFRLLSRALCSVHQLLHAHHKKAPFALFGALWGLLTDYQDLPPCLDDGLTAMFRKSFTDEELLQANAQQLLSVLAMNMDLDIVGIEVRHASVRRINVVKSTQTWSMSLADLGAEFVCRQAAAMREQSCSCLPANKHPLHAAAASQSSELLEVDPDPHQILKRSHRKSTRKNKPAMWKGKPVKKRGQTSYGGAWRAYVHKHSVTGTAAELKSLGQQYRQVKKNPQEFAVYNNMGKMATWAGRCGKRAFTSTGKDKKTKQKKQMVAVGGQIVPRHPCCAKLLEKISEMKNNAKAANLLKEQRQEQRNHVMQRESDKTRSEIENQTGLQDVMQLQDFVQSGPNSTQDLDPTPTQTQDSTLSVTGQFSQTQTTVVSPGSLNIPHTMTMYMPVCDLATVPWLHYQNHHWSLI